MKLAKVRRGLIFLMGVAVACPMVFAGESAGTEADKMEVYLPEVTKSSSTSQGWAVAQSVMPEDGDVVVDTIDTIDTIDYAALEKARIERLKTEGTALNLSKTMENIKVSAEYVLADRYTYQMLLSVEHVDKTPFKTDGYSNFKYGVDFMTKSQYEENKLWKSLPEEMSLEDHIKALAATNEEYKQFIKEDGTVDLEKYFGDWDDAEEAEGNEEVAEEAYATGSSSSSFGECEVENTPEYKRYFLLEGSTREPLGGEMVLELGEYQELENKTCEVALDLVDYLKAHQGDALKTEPLSDYEDEKKYLEELKAADEEAYKRELEYLERIPKKALADGGLKLKVAEEMPSYWIDNIGFVYGQLHMKFLGNAEEELRVEFVSEQADCADMVYGTGSGETDEEGNVKTEAYYVFAIKDLEELEKCEMQITRTVPVVTTKEKCEFEMNLKVLPEKTIAVNKKIEMRSKEKATLKNIVLTDLSLVLDLGDFKRETDNDLGVVITLKDGAEVDQSYSNSTSISKNNARYTYQLECQAADIAKISVGGVEVSVNK